MKNANEPAHPCVVEREAPVSGHDGLTNTYNAKCPGLTKREYFAAMAMQGLLAQDADLNWGAPLIARYAVEQADELLAELEKPA